MQKRTDRIDPLHSWAICAEIGGWESIYWKDRSPLPPQLKRRLDRLRELEVQSPPIVPSDDNF